MTTSPDTTLQAREIPGSTRGHAVYATMCPDGSVGKYRHSEGEAEADVWEADAGHDTAICDGPHRLVRSELAWGLVR